MIRHDVRLTSENVMDIIKDYDVVVNCGDNFPTRYLINDACVFAKKPLVDGAIFRFEGNATVFYPAKGGPCYRCLYPEPAPPDMAPSCAEAGVLGAMPGLIGSIEALEAIKLIIGAGCSADRQDGLLRHAVGQGLRADSEDPQRSEVPGLQRASDADHADRLRSVLRFRRACQWHRACWNSRRSTSRGGVGAVTLALVSEVGNLV